MTKHDDLFYLEGIQEHLDAIKSYLPGSREAFLADTKTQDAVLMRLLAIGEELTNLSDSFFESESQYSWHKIVGLRNRIAYGYFEVDKDVIWETLTDGSLEELAGLIAGDS